MEKSTAKIQCTNPGCQASNHQDVKFCAQCRTPLTKRYLRLIGENLPTISPGSLLGDRYLLTTAKIVLDTKPALTPEIPEDLPEQVITYLKLSPYKLNLPQVFGQLEANTAENPWGIWLLEYSCVPLVNQEKLIDLELFQPLSQTWSKASALRQLNWLWQMAKLWYPLQRQGVASTLLKPDLLRTNGAMVQLLELQSEESHSSNMIALGKFWSSWLDESSPQIREFLAEVCQGLETKEIVNSEQLVAILDQGLFELGRGQKRTYNIFTASESGPSREHNEDACHPPVNKKLTATPGINSLVIVCDGVGGQDAGEVASQMAIQNMASGIKALSFDDQNWNPNQKTAELKRVSNEVNDLISQRNDREERQERKRMGTTLVSILGQAHEAYITHVGDSRIYWISREGCYQLTVDDDLASREVRLGYALYREAIQYPNGGALFQALGMGASDKLYPNVQRFVVDSDCLFLLCSDGLSDNERVDQYWESELLPLLENKADIARVAQKLIKIANETNGHDNVTVALVHCRLDPVKDADKIVIPSSKVKDALNSVQNSKVIRTTPTQKPSLIETQKPTLPKDPPKSKLSPKLWGLLTLSILGLIWLVYALVPDFQNYLKTLVGMGEGSQSPTDGIPPRRISTPENPNLSPFVALKKWDVVKNQQSISLRPSTEETSSNAEAAKKQIPILPGSILQVVDVKEDLVKLKVCAAPKSNKIIEGWITRQDLGAVSSLLTPEEKKLCFSSEPSV